MFSKLTGLLFCELNVPRRSLGRLEHTTRSLSLSRADDRLDVRDRNLNETLAGTGVAPVVTDATREQPGEFSRGTFEVDVAVTTSKRRLALNAARTTSITLGRLRPLSSWLGSQHHDVTRTDENPGGLGYRSRALAQPWLRAATLDIGGRHGTRG